MSSIDQDNSIRESLVAAAIQMNSGPSVAQNLDAASKLVAMAADKGAELVVLPENFAIFGRTDRDKLNVRESPDHGPIQNCLSSLARQHSVWLVGGTIPVAAESSERAFAGCNLYDPTGRCVAQYNKIHLFDVDLQTAQESYRESNSLCPGNKVVVASTPFGGVGLSICYDLRFPELYRAMLSNDVRIITAPAAFTATTGAAHWETLIRARAIENQCFVIASNQTGQLANGRAAHGHSMIVDPWGRILATADESPDRVVTATLNLSDQIALRQSFPCLTHRTL